MGNEVLKCKINALKLAPLDLKIARNLGAWAQHDGVEALQKLLRRYRFVGIAENTVLQILLGAYERTGLKDYAFRNHNA